jgi:hypothetical protein
MKSVVANEREREPHPATVAGAAREWLLGADDAVPTPALDVKDALAVSKLPFKHMHDEELRIVGDEQEFQVGCVPIVARRSHCGEWVDVGLELPRGEHGDDFSVHLPATVVAVTNGDHGHTAMLRDVAAS